MRKKTPVLLVVSFGVFLPVGAGQTPAPPELPQINRANFFPVVRKQVEEAYAAAQANPANAGASGELGMVLDTYEQYETAAVCYERARSMDPVAFRWTYYLGWVQSALGRFEEAESTLNAALGMNPRYLPARLKLAETLLASGKRREAGRIYEALVRQYPDLPAAHYGLGLILAAQGDSKAAIESLRKACDLFPPYGAAHYALALAYRKTGPAANVREEFKLYEQNRASVPGVEDPLRNAVADLNLGPLGHLRRGVSLAEAGRIEEAVAEHLKALEADPNLVQLHINLISLYGKLGRFQQAEEQFRDAVALNRNQAEAYYNYGVLLTKQGRNEEAQQVFQRVLEINPFYAEAHNNLGFLLERQGRLDEALQHYKDAIASLAGYRLARFHAGRILVSQNKYSEAIEQFEKTLTPEDESTPRYLYALGATYARAGSRESALEYLRKAREDAAARGQAQLLQSIEHDLRRLEEAVPNEN